MEATSASLARRWWNSRLGYRFFVEVVCMVGAFFVYKLVRFVMRGEASEAIDNAHTVVDIERALRFFTEPDLQQLVVDHPLLVKFLNQYYIGAHFPVTIAVLVWLYIRRPLGYRTTRRILLVASGVGMLIHIAYPLAPPRMLPSLGFVDTGELWGPAAYGPGAVFGDIANEFAAMPSLHFGWAVIMAVALVRYGRSPLRWLIVLHPMLTTAAIVMTANHYWLDALVAGFVIALLYAISSLGSRMLPRRSPAPPEPPAEPVRAVIDVRDDEVGALRTTASSS
ncbi:MAG TPA: phosphatase PAP2 family protein [Acidimicrobiales bacterium]